MMRRNPHHKRRRGLLGRGALLLMLPTLLAVGCAGHDHGEAAATATPTVASVATATAPVPTATQPTGNTATPTRAPSTATPTPTMNDNAAAACQKLTGCDQCFSNSFGQCISTAACAQRLSTDAAVCINGVSGCNQTTLGNCLFPGCDGNDPSAACQ